MNTNLVDKSFIQNIEHVACLTEGVDAVDFDELGIDKSFYADVALDKVSFWKLSTAEENSTKFSQIVRSLYEQHYDLINPYPGSDENLDAENIYTQRIYGTDDNVLVWRDIFLTWYQYPGRCEYISRIPTAEELVQFEQELKEAIAAKPVVPATRSMLVSNPEAVARKMQNNSVSGAMASKTTSLYDKSTRKGK